ncbi:hypothetical protein [Aquabacterium sp.]|uniref:hypothetical protein n=1 Tax=Aquabacterium sp. TaxID=1872578 RepID=UPI0025C25743|nr:hypothetical protein [Aquabacterium sp.]
MAHPIIETDIPGLYAAIVAAISAQFPELQTVEFDRDDSDRTSLPVPACLLELTEFEAAPELDPGTDQLAVMARFEAELVLGFRTPAVKRSARVLAAALCAFMHKQRHWPNGKAGAIEVLGAWPSQFKPDLDQYEVWRVEWRQPLNLGADIWAGEAGGVVPQTILFGYTPDIGIGHEQDYTPV